MDKITSLTINLFSIIVLIISASSFAQSAWTINQEFSKDNYSNTTRMLGKGLDKNEMFNAQLNLNRAFFNTLKIGSTINLPIKLGKSYQATINKIKQNDNGDKTYFAAIKYKRELLPIVITIGENLFFSRIVTPENIYSIIGSKNKGMIVQESQLNKYIDYTKSDVVHVGSERVRHNDSPQLLSKKSFQKNTAIQSAQINKAIASKYKTESNEHAEIDLMFVYSNTANELYDGEILTRINHIVAVTNQVYSDSNVYITLNVVDTVAVDYADDFNSKDALHDIRDESVPEFHGISDRRYETGADIVVFLRPEVGDGTCGLAFSIGEDTSITGRRPDMYNTVAINCADYVLAHELGHNMGLAHSRRQDPEGGFTFPFSLGYGVDNKFATIMAYENWFATNKVYKFSNPLLNCFGEPCGINKSDVNNGADATFALNAVRFEVANIMHKNPDLSLVENVKMLVQDDSLRTCIENSAIVEKGSYAGMLSRVDCQYRGVASLAGIEHFNGIEELIIGGNEIDDVSMLKSMPMLSILEAPQNKIDDISVLAQLPYIRQIDFSINNIASIPNLESSPLINWAGFEQNNIDNVDNLATLTYLNSLFLSKNPITDITPLNNLQSLAYLYLDDITIDNLDALSSLKNLIALSVVRSNVSNIEGIKSFRKLNNLLLNDNKISDISALSDISSLLALHVERNQVVDLTPLANLTSLFELRLNYNQIEDVSALANLKALEELWLGGNNITNITPLSDLTAMNFLWLQDNNIEDISALTSLTQMEYLLLDHNNISELTSLRELRQLKQLMLAGTQVKSLNDLENIHSLSQLSIKNSKVNDISPLFSLAKEWEWMDLRSNTIFCWQVDYIETVITFTEFLSKPESCNVEADTLDEDEDGLSNRQEIDSGYNPLSSDTDGDGIDDGYEVSHNLSAINAEDAVLDFDNDGYTNIEEYLAGSDPNNIESTPSNVVIPVNNASLDQNGDGSADVLWRNKETGLNWLWAMNGINVSQSKAINSVNLAWDIVGRGDFNSDGKADILWRNTYSGRMYIWLMDGTNYIERQELTQVRDLNWKVSAVSDFNGDGYSDIFWHHQSTGQTYLWLMKGFEKIDSKTLLTVADTEWQVAVAGDVNEDSKTDIIWRHTVSGQNYVWLMNGVEPPNRYSLNTVANSWKLIEAADIDGDNTDDLLWRNAIDGRNWVYLMENGSIKLSKQINTINDASWKMKLIDDLDKDGMADIFWRNELTGQSYIYLMSGIEIKERAWSKTVNNSWQVTKN